MQLTLSRALELLRYEENTGNLIWIISRAGKLKGSIAGGDDGRGYIKIRIDRRDYRAHRLCWLITKGRWPKGEIDHKNGNRSDNRLSNLREVTGQENSKNLSRSKANTSGRTGVCWHKASGKWQARIKVDGRYVSLGVFDSIIDAADARKNAEIRYGFYENHGRDPVQPSRQSTGQSCANYARLPPNPP